MKKRIATVILLWLAIVGAAFCWNWWDETRENKLRAFETARAFFQQIVITRLWNAELKGVYAPVSKDLQPNPYLDDPLRDLTTVQGIKLTKINPAYMTRQLAEIASSRDGILFHITSLKPISPANKATPWEERWLQSFHRGAKEQGGYFTNDSRTVFRYMAPLIVEKSCLQCHAHQGYELGDIRGGISVTIPYLENEQPTILMAGYTLTAVVGVILILIGGRLLEQERVLLVNSNESLQQGIEEQKRLVEDLEEANSRIKTLSGIVPICMHCKQIRDDQGYWNQLEEFISDHSEAQFSHGICPKCLREKYPDDLDDE